MNSAICDKPRTERVRAVDLAEILFRHAHKGDRVFMKMDIEGAEDVVLPQPDQLWRCRPVDDVPNRISSKT
jgi:hypothetical protein